MEATDSLPMNKRVDQVAVLGIDVPEEAFEVYKRIKTMQPLLYLSETMAYWLSLSGKGLRCLFSCLSSCSLSTLKELLKEAEEYIIFCTSMDDVIWNQMVDLDYLQLSFHLNRLQMCLAGHDVLPDNFDFKGESLRAWRDIQEIIQHSSFPFKDHVEGSVMDSKCNSPKSILGVTNINSFSDSDSSKELDIENTNNSDSFSEDDITRLRELLAFALESPQLPTKPLVPSDNLEIGPDNNPTMNPAENQSTQYHPASPRSTQTPTIPTFQTPCKCLYQFPPYPSLPSPCLLFAACERHPGHHHVRCNPHVPATTPIPQINMSPPIYPNFNNNKNFSSAFYNAGLASTCWDPLHYKPCLPHVAPMPIEQQNFKFNSVIPTPSNPSASLPSVPPRINFVQYNFSHGFYNRCPDGGMHRFPIMNNYTNNPFQCPTYHDYELEEKLNCRKSVEIFENEMQELLKGRRKPLRISMLPSMYEERFHRPFNRSHEKLTTLLSKCRNIILIYRPEGQHVIMLKNNESIASTRDSWNGRRRPNQSLDPKNRKIYLTFPPGSTFTSDDAQDYFRQFGPVRGIRMSHEEPPTYAFVEFYTSEGALSALCSTHAHYIAGQKVMVKPYKQSASHKQSNF